MALRLGLIAAALAASNAVAMAQPMPLDTSSAPPMARYGGILEGPIVDIDYRRAIITIFSHRLGRVDVQVMPSTNIQGRNNDYESITDLTRGTRVRIFTSRAGDQYTAQIIKLP